MTYMRNPNGAEWIIGCVPILYRADGYGNAVRKTRDVEGSSQVHQGNEQISAARRERSVMARTPPATHPRPTPFPLRNVIAHMPALRRRYFLIRSK